MSKWRMAVCAAGLVALGIAIGAGMAGRSSPTASVSDMAAEYID